jgi:hypothetical protein
LAAAISGIAAISLPAGMAQLGAAVAAQHPPPDADAEDTVIRVANPKTTGRMYLNMESAFQNGRPSGTGQQGTVSIDHNNEGTSNTSAAVCRT